MAEHGEECVRDEAEEVAGSDQEGMQISLRILLQEQLEAITNALCKSTRTTSSLADLMTGNEVHVRVLGNSQV